MSAFPVTVVMATRNRREQAVATIRRLRSMPDDPPVILVDNGSDDGTPDAVETAYPDGTVIRLGSNEGAVARTAGVEAAQTELVAFADDDSWWAPGSLMRAAELFEAHPRLGLLAARVLVGPEEHLDPVSTEMAASPLGRADDLPGPSVLGFLSCSAVVRRSAYLQVGGFSPVIFFLGEEAVLAQDLAAVGWGLSYVPEVVAHHHPALVERSAARAALQERNALLSTWLRRPVRTSVRHTGSVLRRVGEPHMRKAAVDAFARLPAAVRARRPLPDHVERQLRVLETT